MKTDMSSSYKTSHLEASEMLAEALKQMDGLLNSNSFSPSPDIVQHSQPPGSARREQHQNGYLGHEEESSMGPPTKLAPRMQQVKAGRLLEELRGTLEGMEDSGAVVDKLSADTQDFYREWMGKVLGKELINKSTLETHKLDLMAEISNLKLRLATSDRERRETQERLQHAQRRIDELQSRLNERTVEVTDLRNKLARVQSGGSPYTASLDRSESLKERTFERERTLDRLRRKHTEIQSLQKAVDTLMATNSEKDRDIKELTKLVKRYRRIEEVLSTSHGKKALEMFDLDNLSDTSSTHNSTTSSGNDPRHDLIDNMEPYQKPHMPYPAATSTPVNPHYSTAPRVNGSLDSRPGALTSPHLHPAASSQENLPPLQTPPTVRRRGEQGYAETEVDEEALKNRMALEYKQLQAQNVAEAQKKQRKKGVRAFFGKLKRSNSQELDDQLAEFKRGGVRATASGRLATGYTQELPSDEEFPFSRWDGDRVATWLHNIGLSMYVGECKRWIRHGEQLLRATAQDLEKELGMKNVLHRKKLQLALQAIGSDTALGDMDKLDYNWVTRWLDDIGLPQYKEVFAESRVDGRMLHHMTVDDLVVMKISSAMHHLSIKTGIQVLRLNRFNASCLKRRPLPDEGNMEDCPQEVMSWTNHRVMEWLRSIDLSEYAPNLRGSGVHGGLMVLEPRFGAELFATILSIPQSKTLLRRHLTTHFVTLVGQATQQRKREVESSQGFQPLTPNQKVKVKKSLFGHRRTRSECETDYICPMDEKLPNFDSAHSNGGPARGNTLDRENPGLNIT